MNAEETRAVLAIALMAAYADGHKADAERDEVRRVAESLGAEAGQLSLPALYQDVLLRRIDIAKAAAALGSSEVRQLAFELAVGVCDADVLRNEAETRFLADLGAALKLTPPQMAEPAAVADALVTLPLDTRWDRMLDEFFDAIPLAQDVGVAFDQSGKEDHPIHVDQLGLGAHGEIGFRAHIGNDPVLDPDGLAFDQLPGQSVEESPVSENGIRTHFPDKVLRRFRRNA